MMLTMPMKSFQPQAVWSVNMDTISMIPPISQ